MVMVTRTGRWITGATLAVVAALVTAVLVLLWSALPREIGVVQVAALAGVVLGVFMGTGWHLAMYLVALLRLPPLEVLEGQRAALAAAHLAADCGECGEPLRPVGGGWDERSQQRTTDYRCNGRPQHGWRERWLPHSHDLVLLRWPDGDRRHEVAR